MLADYKKGPSDPDVTDTPRLRGLEQQPHCLLSQYLSITNSAIPARPSGTVPGGLGTARFTKALELKKRRSARCPRVAALVQLRPPKPPPRPHSSPARLLL
jgi:hypothetical protein